MATIQMTTSELAKMFKSFSEDFVSRAKGISDGVALTVEYDHGIPLLPKKIPVKLQYIGMEKGIIYFEVHADSKGLIGKAFSVILKGLSSVISENELFDGVYLKGNKIQIIPKEFFEESGINVKFNSIDISSSKVLVDFNIK